MMFLDFLMIFWFFDDFLIFWWFFDFFVIFWFFSWFYDSPLDFWFFFIFQVIYSSVVSANAVSIEIFEILTLISLITHQWRYYTFFLSEWVRMDEGVSSGSEWLAGARCGSEQVSKTPIKNHKKSLKIQKITKKNRKITNKNQKITKKIKKSLKNQKIRKKNQKIQRRLLWYFGTIRKGINMNFWILLL